jgi:hypothetical protein
MQSSVGAAADARTGRPATRQQALEEGARVVHLVQISTSQLLVVGADKEARHAA